MELSMTGQSTMKGLVWCRRGVKTGRESSYDRTGGNADARPIEPGGTLTLAELKGPGCITHLWFTISAEDQYYLRSLVLRMWWDGETGPSVEVPVGDFFGLGHARLRAYQCYPFSVSSGKNGVGGGSGMNCYFQMPFAKSARITVENQSSQRVGSFYFYVDYETYSQLLPEDILRFHAQWRRENPTTPIKGYLGQKGINYSSLTDVPNLDGKENYVILEAEGKGHYVGCNLSIDNFDTVPNGNTTWWGEGDDMIYIDGDKMPTMTGTGTEDYFCHAWGMQDVAGLYAGVSIWHWVPGSSWGGKFTCYRYHIEDPAVFEKSIKVSIEHGHANLQGNDYASTAYWYQTEPHKPHPALPSREARMPRPDFVPPVATGARQVPGPRVKPFIQEWLALGPFENTVQSLDEVKAGKKTAVDTVYPPEKDLKSVGGKAGMAKKYKGKDGLEIRWARLDPAHVKESGLVDLFSVYGKEWAVCYLMTRIYSQKDRKAILWLGSDDGCKVWLNGKQVFRFVGARGPEADTDAVDIRLKRGWNTLVLKVEQFTLGWGVYARIEEAITAGKEAEDLTAAV